MGPVKMDRWSSVRERAWAPMGPRHTHTHSMVNDPLERLTKQTCISLRPPTQLASGAPTERKMPQLRYRSKKSRADYNNLLEDAVLHGVSGGLLYICTTSGANPRTSPSLWGLTLEASDLAMDGYAAWKGELAARQPCHGHTILARTKPCRCPTRAPAALLEYKQIGWTRRTRWGDAPAIPHDNRAPKAIRGRVWQSKALGKLTRTKHIT